MTAQPGHVHAETITVLVVPEALGPSPDLASLRVFLAPPDMHVRVIVRVVDAAGLQFATAIATPELTIEFLLAPSVSALEGFPAISQMPQGSSIEELDTLALAFVDGLVADDGDELPEPTRRLLDRAAHLGKTIFPTTGKLRCVTGRGRSVADALDPAISGWHSWGRNLFGRFEQLALEVLAFGWRDERSVAHSFRQLLKCIGRWAPGHYFAPGEWRTAIPDSATATGDSPTMKQFEAFDRSALYGSYIHRDMIWITHMLAATAVLLAVTGSLFPAHSLRSEACALIEFLLLLFIALAITAAQVGRLQDRWTACRLGAEQLRIACMCLPLMVVPPALMVAEDGLEAAADSQTPKRWMRTARLDFDGLALAQARHAVRGQGLPRLKPDYDPMQGAVWLQLIVRNQITYHANNHRKLEYVERRLRLAKGAIFVASLAAVAVHLLVSTELRWLLLITAAGPAFAAALHGAETRLGIVYRAGMSQDAHQILTRIDQQIDAFRIAPPAMIDARWTRLRSLALAAAGAMGRENDSWHRLLRLDHDGLPV